jgi:hypothetical protein
MGHVANVIGGVEKINLFYGDADRRFFPIDAGKQREALAFLNEHAFSTPELFLDPDVTGRLEAAGIADRVLAAQRSLLNMVVNEPRIKRMAEIAVENPDSAYAPLEMMTELTDGLWSELGSSPGGKTTIDLYRRNLQRAHIDRLIAGLDSEDPASDLPAIARTQLEWLADRCASQAPTGTDRMTQRHLEDAAARIRLALDKVKVETEPQRSDNNRRR